MGTRPEAATYRAPNGMVVSIDHLASSAGLEVLRRGGSAADAAIATNAVLTVTSQHMCGLGGDLFAIVHPGGTGPPQALNASGRAGSGADAVALREEGHESVPFRGDVRAVTVPGCVDGWWQLHARFGRLEWRELFGAAIRYAERGFPASPTLAASAPAVRDVAGAEVFRGRDGAGLREGELVRRPALAAMLREVATGGRAAWYGGRFGAGLVELGDGLFTEADLLGPHADWVSPLHLDVWGQRLWTTPPNTQGYLTLASAGIAEGLGLPETPDDPGWPHVLVEASKAAGVSRPAELHEDADAAALLANDRLTRLRAEIGDRAGEARPPVAAGDTTHLCVVDGEGAAVSLIQSNAAGFGAHLVVPGTDVHLHNRGIGFSLEPGHPAELAAGRRPPHTLAPAMVTGRNGELHTVLGTMGGDRQPQILLQLLAGLLVAGRSAGEAVAAARWGLGTGTSKPGFSTWEPPGDLVVELESDVPDGWARGLSARGHRVRVRGRYDSAFGHAHVVTAAGGMLAGASDPRAGTGAAAGF